MKYVINVINGIILPIIAANSDIHSRHKQYMPDYTVSAGFCRISEDGKTIIGSGHSVSLDKKSIPELDTLVLTYHFSGMLDLFSTDDPGLQSMLDMQLAEKEWKREMEKKVEEAMLENGIDASIGSIGFF